MYKVFVGNPAIASKLIIIALRNNNQRIALNEILRMGIKFVIAGQYLTLFWKIKYKFREIVVFRLSASILADFYGRERRETFTARSLMNM